MYYKSFFPQTRYQGSKRKLLKWYLPFFKEVKFDSVLDVFGGTGAVSHLFKRMGKKVTYNDFLISNWYVGLALIENKDIKLNLSRTIEIFKKNKDINYLTVIQENFKDIYYIDEENKLLDVVVQNILHLENRFEKSLNFYALFQACLQKRPFNLFHRKNLNLRLKNVRRSFGNFKTWDTPFIDLFKRAMDQANRAIFDNDRINRAINYSIDEIPIPQDGYDLVYFDPPYVSENGKGLDYRDYYHFLEGICQYYSWKDLIDYESKHRRLKILANDWISHKTNTKAFERTIKKFQDSKIVISYRDPGLPKIKNLCDILTGVKKKITINRKKYKYALTSKYKDVEEVLIFAN